MNGNLAANQSRGGETMRLVGSCPHARSYQCPGLFPEENPNPVIFCKTDGQVLYLNPAGEEVLKHFRMDDIVQLLPEEHSSILQSLAGNSHRSHTAIRRVQDRYFEWYYHTVANGESFHLHAQDVTERIQAAEELRESEEWFRTVVENLNEGLLVADRNDHIIYLNSRMAGMCGYSIDDLLGESALKLWPEHLRSGITERTGRRHEGLDERYESQLLHRDGNLIWVKISATPYRNRKGEILGSFGIFTDISEQKRAEFMQESLYRISKAVDSTKNLDELFFAVHKIIGNVMPAQNFYISVYDEKNDLLTFPYYIDESTPPSPPRKPRKGLTEYVLRTGKPLLCPEDLFDDLIQRGEVELSGEPSKIWLGVPLKIDKKTIGVMTVQHYRNPDAYKERERQMLEFVSSEVAKSIERKRSEQELIKSETRFQDIAFSSADWIWEVDQDGKYTFAGGKVKEILGYELEEIIGKTPFDLMEPEEAERVGGVFRKIIGEKRPIIDLENWNLTKSGERVCLLTNGVPILGEKGELLGYRGVDKNITERKRAEAEREKLEAQIRRTQKLETIGTLAGGIAHDFNNILMPILGYAEMVADDIPPSSVTRENLEHVIQAAHRAKDLVRQILTFSRQGEQEKKPLALHPIVKEALKLIRASLPSTIEIKGRIDAQCGAVNADPSQIHQVLMNLCTNAFHAMRDNGGILDVSLNRIEVDKEFAGMHPNLHEGSYVRLTIGDSGVGMDRATIERIFEPFFTTKDVGEGTGLGLAVVHGIVMEHGGDISVYSELGRGTTFHVYFPVADHEKAPAAVQQESALTGQERILLVDDEAEIAQMGKQMLERLGYRVSIRTSSVEALEAFRANPQDYDLIITDHTMPQMTGTQMTKEIIRIRPDIPVILITGFSEKITPETCETYGIREYVMKPIVARELSRTIRRVVDECRQRNK